MPRLVAVAAHECRGRDRRANRTIVNQLARGLRAAAKESIRGTARPQLLLFGQGQHLLAFRPIDAKRLFRIGMLACAERSEIEFSVRFWHGQVENNLNARIGQEFRDGTGTDAVFFGLCGSPGRIEIRARDNLDI